MKRNTVLVLVLIFSLVFAMGAFAQTAATGTQPQNLIKATDVMGKKVQSVKGEDLGQITNIVMDTFACSINYAIVSFENKLYPVPVSALSGTPGRDYLIVNVDKAKFVNAPSFTETTWATLLDRRFGTEIYGYYGIPPVWESRTAGTMGAAAAAPAAGAPTTLVRSGELIGKDVMTQMGDELGEVKDVVIDTRTGNIAFAVISYQDRLYPVPISMLSVDPGVDKLVLNIDKSRFANAPSFTEDTWANITERQYGSQVYRYYGLAPYWETGRMPAGAISPPAETMPSNGFIPGTIGQPGGVDIPGQSVPPWRQSPEFR
jgi:sporulation protein YlmC with PRC-barrel domain